MRRPLVYIASPYTHGDVGINVHFQCRMFDELLREELVVPLVPLWTHFQHLLFPRTYQDWVEYDNAIIERCDACLRLNVRYFCPSIHHSGPPLIYEEKKSKGADAEVELFKSLSKPVFYSKIDLYEWVSEQSERHGGTDRHRTALEEQRGPASMEEQQEEKE